METFSALLAICVGNSSVTGEFPAQRSVTRMFSLICAWIKGWVNNGEAGDLRRHRAHYDVNVKWTSHFEICAVQPYVYKMYKAPNVMRSVSTINGWCTLRCLFHVVSLLLCVAGPLLPICIDLYSNMISNHVPSNVWDEVTYQFPNLNGIIVAIGKCIRNFISLYGGCNYLFLLGLQYISERMR